jgi:hypothetical protein
MQRLSALFSLPDRTIEELISFVGQFPILADLSRNGVAEGINLKRPLPFMLSLRRVTTRSNFLKVASASVLIEDETDPARTRLALCIDYMFVYMWFRGRLLAQARFPASSRNP